MTPQQSEGWVRERTEGPVRIEHYAQRVHFQGRSPYQEILLAENELSGKFLMLDGDIQSSTHDAPFYHEVLVHPALLSHPNPQRVLILGGGEGSSLREVLRHQCVREVVMVELDATVVKACRNHAPEYHAGAFQDPRSHLIIGDALHYLQENLGYFDVILGDLTADAPLSYPELYRLVAARLGLEGIFCAQVGSGSPRQEATFVRHYRMIAKHWSVLTPLTAFVPCYHSLWCFLMAAHGDPRPSISARDIDALLIERGITSLRVYDGEFHQRLVSLPRHLRRALA
jgi:spermidine synthase